MVIFQSSVNIDLNYKYNKKNRSSMKSVEFDMLNIFQYFCSVVKNARLQNVTILKLRGKIAHMVILYRILED